MMKIKVGMRRLFSLGVMWGVLCAGPFVRADNNIHTELRRFKSEHGLELAPELHQRLETYWNLYHGSTLQTAHDILKADAIRPEERIFELDAFLRSREGEWTAGSIAHYLVGKKGDSLRDGCIAAAVKVYAAKLTIPLKLILGANNVVSFLPGFSVGVADDLIAYLEKESSTDNHRQVYEFLKECRSLSSDVINARIADHNTRINANFRRINSIPDEVRLNVIRDVPEALLRRYSGNIWWEYVNGSLPPNHILQIRAEFSGRNPQFDDWVRKCQAHYRKARAETLTLIRQSILLRQLNTTAELRLQAVLQPENSILILIDASGSMDGEKIATAIATASRQIQRLGPDTELAVRAFSGNSVNFPFVVMTPDAQARAQAAVNSITSGGGTPLAAGIRSAGEYIRRNARGKSITLIILSDGEETAGGNPPAEVARLNDINVRW